MDISPCPCVVTLSDGKNHTLFKFRDFLELVDEKMGMDARKWLEEHVERLEAAADYTTAKIDTDLVGYEASLGSNTTAFMDIREAVGAIQEILDGPRINRRKITEAIKEIEKIIGNQI